MLKPILVATLIAGHRLYAIANQLFSHCILAGLPIALAAARIFGRRAAAAA